MHIYSPGLFATVVLFGVFTMSLNAQAADKVIEASGRYAGYTGGFDSFGLIDLGEGKVVLRYNGEICK